MRMGRLIFSFIFAALCHVVVLWGPVNMSRPPQPVSNTSLTVTLSHRAEPQKEKRTESHIEVPRRQTVEKSLVKKSNTVRKPQRVPVEPEVNLENKQQGVVETIHPKKIKKIIKPVLDRSDVAVKERVSSPNKRKQNDKVIPSSSPMSGPEIKSLVTESLSTTDSVIEATPLYQYNPKPLYPPLARKRKWAGTVIIKTTVLSDGTSTMCVLHKSSGYEILDNSALRAVKKWRFLPGTVNGKPHRMMVLVPVHFILK